MTSVTLKPQRYVEFSKMDRLRGTKVTGGNINVTSLEECYTGFDKWVLNYKLHCSKRSHRDPETEEKKNISTEETLSLNELLIHGIFIQKTHLSNVFFNNNLINDNVFVSIDYVILEFMKKRNYMRSKLYSLLFLLYNKMIKDFCL